MEIVKQSHVPSSTTTRKMARLAPMSKLVSIDAMSSRVTKLNAMEVISLSSSAPLVGILIIPKSVRCVDSQYRYSLLPPAEAATAVSPREL